MEDWLNIAELLSDEEKIIRETVRDFVATEVSPLLAQAYETAEFPHEIVPRLAQLGLLGMALPVEGGGAGASAVAYGLACQELERGDSSLRSFVSVQGSLCMQAIWRYGTAEQKERFLPAMAQGQVIGCFGLTEANSGSDPASMTTQARKVSGGFQLNGSKTWITNAPFADIAIVWAKTAEGIRGFIVEKEFAGCQRLPIKHKLSLRASATGELIFTDCFVPEENYLPGSEIGLLAPLGCLTEARYGIAWGAIGAAMACYDIALAYTKQRIQFNRPLAACQLVQKDLVDMLNDIGKSQLLNLRIGRLKEQHKADFALVSWAKMNACQVGLKVARMARNLLGANGISLEYQVMRHMLNLEAVATYEGTDNIHHLILGKYLTGHSAF